MFFVGVLVAIAIEIAAFVVVADHVGVVWALVLVFGVSAFGPMIVRRVGVGILVQTRERLGRGELPSRELLDGLVVLIAGVMICVPGFVGDALGLMLMIGPVRHLVIRLAGNRLARTVGGSGGGRWRVVDTRARRTHDVSGLSPGRVERDDRHSGGAHTDSSDE